MSDTTADRDTVQLHRETPDPRVERFYSDVLGQANDETVPSGILLLTESWNEELDALDGSASSLPITQLRWLDTYGVISAGAIDARGGTSANVMAEAERFLSSGVVPIFIADFSYARVRPRFFAHVRRASNTPTLQSVAVPRLADVVEQSDAFFASILLPTEYDLFTPHSGRQYGKRIKLVVPASGYKTNSDRTIARIDLDFGDGSSVSVRPDEIVEHEFAEYGTKRVTLSVHTSDDAIRSASFTFEVAEPAPQPNDIWEFRDNDGKLRATAWVYHATAPRRTKIEKPVLLAEGFPGGRTLDQLWPLVNTSSFVTDLLAQGRDFIILGFADGTKPIQENGGLYAACIAKIIAAKQNNEKIAAGGASMGGLIARFALCRMEKGNVPHHVGLFFTIDTPHEGANIPLSAQAFVQFYAAKPCGRPAAGPAAQMASVAAQQMLLQWIPPYEQWREGPLPGWSIERDKFIADLEHFDWMPKKVGKRIGVANGTGDGGGNGVPPHAQTLSFNVPFYTATMRSAGEVPGLLVDMVNGFEGWRIVGGNRRIDGAPGGTRTTWGEISANLPWRSSNPFPLHCFVPSTSACAIASADLYVNDLERRPSNLDAFKVSATNTPHVELSPDLKKFLVDEILNV